MRHGLNSSVWCMAKAKARVKLRGDAKDWPRIRTEYITSQISREELSVKHGVSLSALNKRAAKDLWKEAREDWRQQNAIRLQSTTEDELLQQKQQAIKIAVGLKLRIAKRLQERLDNDPTYHPTPKDWEIVQRLEMDLKEPGWSKQPGEGQVNVNVGVKVEQILDALEEKRKAVDSETLTLQQMDEGTAGFLYGDSDADATD